METRKAFKKEKQDMIIKEEQFNEYEIPLQSKAHYSNNGSCVNVKEEDMNQEMPVEEQFIEISTNTASKMDQTSNVSTYSIYVQSLFPICRYINKLQKYECLKSSWPDLVAMRLKLPEQN